VGTDEENSRKNNRREEEAKGVTANRKQREQRGREGRSWTMKR